MKPKAILATFLLNFVLPFASNGQETPEAFIKLYNSIDLKSYTNPISKDTSLTTLAVTIEQIEGESPQSTVNLGDAYSLENTLKANRNPELSLFKHHAFAVSKTGRVKLKIKLGTEKKNQSSSRPRFKIHKYIEFSINAKSGKTYQPRIGVQKSEIHVWVEELENDTKVAGPFHVRELVVNRKKGVQRSKWIGWREYGDGIESDWERDSRPVYKHELPLPEPVPVPSLAN